MTITHIQIFKKRKSLFETRPSTKLSQIGWGKSELRLMGYYLGYKNGADALVEKILNDDSSKSYDTLIYPVLFLYRHYLELVLKYIYIVFSNESTENKIKFIKAVSHDINKVWQQKVKQILKNNEVCDVDIDVAENYINEFSLKDENSFYFRYPFDKHLNMVINHEQWIDIENFKDIMDEIYLFFETCINTLHAEKDIENEFLILEHELDKMLDNEMNLIEYERQQEYNQIMAEQHKDILKEYEKCFGIMLE